MDMGFRFSKPKWVLDPETFPTLPEGRQRVLYVAGLDQLKAETLTAKGYTLIDVRTMERETPQDEAVCIEAWIQGMAEQTIEPNPERRRTLELEAKAHGLLVNRTLKLEAKVKASAEDLDRMLDRLVNLNETMRPVSRARIEAAEKAALIPGFKLEGE